MFAKLWEWSPKLANYDYSPAALAGWFFCTKKLRGTFGGGSAVLVTSLRVLTFDMNC